ncbi:MULTISPECIES: amidohydrolase family protein [Flavobacteriaceae]|uniref:amidohydrolase family protein n=1 Tax=Flavobacteriaceae TaxID=49546 RepID=UPI001FE2EADE|nr:MULTISPECIES: amidohydrolase family protein [Allomuricauda]MDC6366912.1 amidohydrolase family protein [Muricauda sp. AC10]
MPRHSNDMTIDSHQHFWKYHPRKHAWINDSMKILKKDFMPSDLAPLLQANQIDGCIAVQADQSETETNLLLKCAQKYPFIKGVVGWLDLCSANIDEKLEKYSKYALLKGLRHIVQDEPDEYFMLRPEFQKGIALLEKYGLTYDILIYPKHLSSALELVKTFPGQQFVVDHIAKPKIDGTIDPCWAHYMEKLGEQSNVYCKVSGMVTETSWGNWHRKDFPSYLDVVFDAFGPNRIMYGSDWPVCLLSAEYNDVVDIVQRYISKFSKEIYNKVMGLNAISFYQIKA